MITITLMILFFIKFIGIFGYPFSEMNFQDYPNLPYKEYEPTLNYYDGEGFHDGFSIQLVNEVYAFSSNRSICEGYLYVCQGISAGIKEIEKYDDYSLGWFNLEMRVNHQLTCSSNPNGGSGSSKIIFPYLQPQSEVSSHEITTTLKMDETIDVEAAIEYDFIGESPSGKLTGAYSRSYGKTTSTQSNIKDWNVRQTQIFQNKTNFLYYQQRPWSLYDGDQGMTNSSNFNVWKESVIKDKKVVTPPEISLSFLNQRLFIPFKIRGDCESWELTTTIQPTLGLVLLTQERIYLKSKKYTDLKVYPTTHFFIDEKEYDFTTTTNKTNN
ncbi:hypothetical protein ACTA71_007602 [Dictyostelium dimigraforme]